MRRALFLVALLAALAACRRDPSPAPGRLAELRRLHETLHEQLDARVAEDALVQEALHGRPGELIVAVRSPMVEDVLREAARVYIDRLTLDLGDLQAKANGRIDHRTFLGRIKVGEWRLEMLVEQLAVELRAKAPRLRVAGTNEVELKLPVEAREARGRVVLRFSWDSASVANLVCRDFEVARELEGKTPRQEHTIGGVFRLSAAGDSVRVQPVFPDDTIRVKVALSDRSWASVREALAEQDRFLRCGLLMDPDKMVDQLKARAAEGFPVKLPAVMFREFRFPGAFERTAQIEGRAVAVGLRTQGFEVTPSAMWSRAAIGIGDRPLRTAREAARTQSASVSEDGAAELSDSERCRHEPPHLHAAADLAGALR
jgi:hypothetical protein